MQTPKLPRSLCDDVDKRVRRFIWGGSEEHRAVHLLSWDVLQKSPQQGGIAVPAARLANDVFLTKLGWHTLTEPNALWARVLRAKYCKRRCDLDMFNPKPGMSNVWNGISDNAKVLSEDVRVCR